MNSTSWAAGFGLGNLPYGVFTHPALGAGPRIGVAFGDRVLDVSAPALRLGLEFARELARPSLNPFMALGPAAWAAARAWLTEVLGDSAHRAGMEPHLYPVRECRLHLPFEIADFVDFYASEHHATRLGELFRPGLPPLTPNWKHLPIGYHGRSGTVVVSGTDVIRPCGQSREAGAPAPSFGASARLDVEVEVGFVVGAGSPPGEPVATREFADHVFGVVLVNDWSARDLQSWEYVPLGPFLGKSFATSIGAWVVPLDALDAAWVPLPPHDVATLGYLEVAEPAGLDLDLSLELNGTVLSRPPYRAMYWSPAQMIAHATVNGARLRTGDLFASGTVSGPGDDERGSLIELTMGGTRPLSLPGDRLRTFLADGDEAVIRGWAPGRGGERISLGEVRGRVLPASTRRS